jgi:hypothetical protein
MANTSRLKLTGLLVLIVGLTLLPTQTLTSTAQQGFQDTLIKRQQLLDQRLAKDRRQAELDRSIANFKKSKELLIKKGVPFDPDILLTRNWRKSLAPHFEQMAEMQEVKIGPGRFKGVQMAHTLYLPEKVELVGDTVILAHNLIFEGRDAVIKGNFSIAVYPIEQTGLLGTSLEQALERSGPRFVDARFSGAAARTIPANLPLIKGGSLTIDTSGFGYKQWLEQQAAMKKRKGGFVQAAFVPQDDLKIKNGKPGEPGKDQDPGADGPNVIATGTKGADGTCGSTTTVIGKIGASGPSGNNGQKQPLTGGRGGDGGPAGEVVFDIPDKPIDRYVFQAMGGNGGPGGRGGNGGWGSKGGRGGQGGIGANCPCAQGGSGAGGPGGPGGPGGSGADGSDGGQGGNGGSGNDILVTYHVDYTGEILAYPWRGLRGPGGPPGSPGVRGGGGDGGPGGFSGGVSICTNQGWGGDTGSKGTNGLDGNSGAFGPPGERDGLEDGMITLAPRGFCLSVEDCSIYGDGDRPWIWKGYPDCQCVPPIGVPTYDVDSPIIIDLDGNGFSLTDALHGVNFDLNADGPVERVSWTASGSDDAFLALDLNQNGLIDSGAELFGNHTPQPPSATPNGFIALAEFDKEENGGNGNGVIAAGDAVYARLLLWQDTNHNGKSDPGELHLLTQSKVTEISLDYKRSNRRDEHGNLFLYRSRIQVAKRSSVERWAYDVFLVLGS